MIPQRQLSLLSNRLATDGKRRISAQMAELPEFGTVYRVVQRALRQAGLIRAS